MLIVDVCTLYSCFLFVTFLFRFLQRLTVPFRYLSLSGSSVLSSVCSVYISICLLSCLFPFVTGFRFQRLTVLSFSYPSVALLFFRLLCVCCDVSTLSCILFASFLRFLTFRFWVTGLFLPFIALALLSSLVPLIGLFCD